MFALAKDRLPGCGLHRAAKASATEGRRGGVGEGGQASESEKLKSDSCAYHYTMCVVYLLSNLEMKDTTTASVSACHKWTAASREIPDRPP